MVNPSAMSWSHFTQSSGHRHPDHVSLPPISHLLNDIPDSDRHQDQRYYRTPPASSYPTANQSPMQHPIHSYSGPSSRTGVLEQDFRYPSLGPDTDPSRASVVGTHISSQISPHWNPPQSLPRSGPVSPDRFTNQYLDGHSPPRVPSQYQKILPGPQRSSEFILNPYSAGSSNDMGEAQAVKLNHVCEYCGKAFLRPSALKTHVISHTGDQDFVCPEEGCERRFGVRSNMLRHVRLVHRHLKHSSGEQLTQDEWETGEPGF